MFFNFLAYKLLSKMSNTYCYDLFYSRSGDLFPPCSTFRAFLSFAENSAGSTQVIRRRPVNRILLTLAVVAVVLPLPLFAQPQVAPPAPDSDILDFAEEEAEFPGGHKALRDFIETTLVFPPRIWEEDQAGKVVVRFVVEKDGSITNGRVIKGMANCLECDKEALSLLKTMPRWKPGKTGGKPVRQYYNYPLTFRAPVLLPQGYEVLQRHLEKNLRYPARALEEKTEGRVYVRVMLGESKAIEQVSLWREMNNYSECDEEALRVLKTIPDTLLTLKSGLKTPFYFNTYVEFKIEKEAEFIGSLRNYVQFNRIYPPRARKEGFNDYVLVKATITEKGKPTNVQLEKKMANCPECDKEAIRLVKAMPDWKPAKRYDGTPFKSNVKILVDFPPLYVGTPVTHPAHTAHFTGGYAAEQAFIQCRLKVPKKVKKTGYKGESHLRFIVEKDGTINSIEVLKGAKDCPECDEAAIKLVKAMPKWIPAMNGEKEAIRSYGQRIIRFGPQKK